MKRAIVIIISLILFSPLTAIPHETEDYCEKYYELSKKYVAKAEKKKGGFKKTSLATTSIAYSRLYLNCKVWQEKPKQEPKR